MKVGLVLNPSHGIKKSKIKIRCVHDMNAKGFYYKNMTIIEQNHDKDTYPKLMLNGLKLMWDFTFIYTNWALSSRKFLKKLPTYMCPMFTYVQPCVTHVWPMSIHVEINSEIKMN
jgi:hypothetical protein